MPMSLRRVGCEKIVRGIPIRGKEETKKVLKGLLSVRQSFSSLKPSSVSSQAERIYMEICANLDAYGHFKGYFTEEGLGTLFHNSEISITPLGGKEETYILKIDIPFEQKDVIEIFTADFLRIKRALQSVQIPLNFWPFLPNFQMDFKELAGRFPQIPGFSVKAIKCEEALERFSLEKSYVLAQGNGFKVKVYLKGVNVFERVKVQENSLSAPYFVNQRTDDRKKDLFEEPAVILSMVGKRNYMVDQNEKNEACDIAGEIEKVFLRSVLSREEITGDVLPITLEELLMNPFHPRQLRDDILMCQLFRKLLFLAEDQDIAQILEKHNLIKEKMREIVEIWEQREYIVGIDRDDSQPNVAELCANEIRRDVGRITSSLWLDPAEKSIHERNLTTRVRPVRFMG